MSGDGRLDLVIANWGSHDVSVLLNTGSAAGCNSNGLFDDCDIAAGTRLDCNSNGAPDECGLAGAVELAKLTASDGAADDYFGITIALSGDTVVVGANSDDIGANTDQGSAYVFVRSGTTWTHQAKLTASDGGAGDLFGGSVALAGNTAIVVGVCTGGQSRGAEHG